MCEREKRISQGEAARIVAQIESFLDAAAEERQLLQREERTALLFSVDWSIRLLSRQAWRAAEEGGIAAFENQLNDPDDPCNWLLDYTHRLLPDESRSPVNRYRGFMFGQRVSEAFDGATLSPVCAMCDAPFSRDRDFCQDCGSARRLVTKQYDGIDAQYVNGWVQYWIKNNGPLDPDFNLNTINASVKRMAFHAWRLAGRPDQLGNDTLGHEEELRRLTDLFALSQALSDLSLQEGRTGSNSTHQSSFIKPAT